MTLRRLDLPKVAGLLLLGILYGTMYPVNGHVAKSLPGLTLTATGVRFLVAALSLGLVAFVVAPGSRPTRRQFAVSAAVGACLIGSVGLYSYAQRVVPPGLTALLLAVWPAFLVVLGWATGRGKPTGPRMGGVALGFAGVGLLLASRNRGTGASSPVEGNALLSGSLIILFAAFLYAAGMVCRQPLGERTDEGSRQRFALALWMSAAQTLVGGGAVLFVGRLSGEWASIHPARLPPCPYGALAYLLACSMIAFPLLAWLKERCANNPALLGVPSYLSPMVAALVGSQLGEQIGWVQTLATALILTAVWLMRDTTPVPQASDAAPDSSQRLPQVPQAPAITAHDNGSSDAAFLRAAGMDGEDSFPKDERHELGLRPPSGGYEGKRT